MYATTQDLSEQMQGGAFPEMGTELNVTITTRSLTPPEVVYANLCRAVPKRNFAQGWSHADVYTGDGAVEEAALQGLGEGWGIRDVLRRIGFYYDIAGEHKNIVYSHSPLGRTAESCLRELDKYAKGETSPNKACTACINFMVMGLRQRGTFYDRIETEPLDGDAREAIKYILSSMAEKQYRPIIESFPPEIQDAILREVFDKNPELDDGGSTLLGPANRITIIDPDLKDLCKEIGEHYKRRGGQSRFAQEICA